MTGRRVTRRSRRESAARIRPRRLAALCALGAMLAMAGSAVVPLGLAQAAADTPGYSVKKDLTREHVEADGSTTAVDSRAVTVSVDHTQNLRGRERVQVTWTGAHPSAARTLNPYGAGGLNQEYPVVILQCRGLDDPSLPADQQLRPETCWTTTFLQRYASAYPTSAIWRSDRYATAADRADQESATSWPEACLKLPGSISSQHLLPFVSAKGTVFQECDSTTIPPESALNAALPAPDVAAYTALDGTGSIQYEVRTNTENESLGCSSDVPCSLVVIPIMGISCDTSSAACRAAGSFAPGTSNDTNGGVDTAVSASMWWSASNWRGRFSVPLSFALPPDACDVLDSRSPVDMFGSELLNQASLQWAPAYCLRSDRFKFRHNRMSEAAALRLLGTGDAAAAFVTEPATSSPNPLAYAPIAVTGFGIAFVVDKPNNAGEVETLKLSPRLLAKLLTQSYTATYSGRLRPGLEKNPVSINQDPEFQQLNPGIATDEDEAKATLLSLSDASDVMTALTSYIASDADASAFIAGAADPWGMKINPAYKDIEVPRDEWPMLDTWIRPSLQECQAQVQTPYFSLIAAPVNSVKKISDAVLDAWPNVQTQCTRSLPTDPWKFGRVARQSYGLRFMLGLVSLADADRYGLRTAALQTGGSGSSGTFVAASPTSMAKAIETSSQPAPGEPYLFDYGTLDPAAYPGTMVVNLAARLSGLPATTAAHVGQFIDVATTEGQTPGPDNGELPDGYLPIVNSGSTARLFASAQLVSAAIVRQSGVVQVPTATPTPTSTPTPTPTVPSAVTSAVTPTVPAPGTGALTLAPLGSVVPARDAPAAGAASVPGLPADNPTGGPATAPVALTVSETSGAANAALPAALSVGLAGAFASPLLRMWSTRRRIR